MFWLLLQKPNLSPFPRAAAHQEPREHASGSLSVGRGWVVCFVSVVVFVFCSPVERARDREVTLLLTTLVALCVSVMKG